MFLSAGSRARARLASLWKANGTSIFYAGGNVGIGDNNPQTKLCINANPVSGFALPISNVIFQGLSANGSNANFTLVTWNNGVAGVTSSNNMFSARGTLASPGAIQSADVLGQYLFGGYNGATYLPVSAAFQCTATENWSGAARGSAWAFNCSANGTHSNGQTMRLGQGLYVGAASTDPGAGNIQAASFLNTGGFSRVSSQFDKTSDAALANVPGLTTTVAAGQSYFFRAVLFTSSNSAGGVQAAIGGSASATAVRYEALVHDAAAVKAQARATALGTAVGGVTAVSAAKVEIEGLITVNAGGTLTVQFAQNASNGTASSVLTGSYLQVFQVT